MSVTRDPALGDGTWHGRAVPWLTEKDVRSPWSHLHLTDEDTEAQAGEVPCPKSQSQSGTCVSSLGQCPFPYRRHGTGHPSVMGSLQMNVRSMEGRGPETPLNTFCLALLGAHPNSTQAGPPSLANMPERTQGRTCAPQASPWAFLIPRGPQPFVH